MALQTVESNACLVTYCMPVILQIGQLLLVSHPSSLTRQ